MNGLAFPGIVAMDLKKVGGIVLVLAIAGGILYFKFGKKAEASDQVKKEIMAFLPRVKDYEKYKSKLTQWADEAHHKAFESAYDIGGRRSATFDEDAYTAKFFDILENRAQMAGLRDLENNLRTLAVEYDNAAAARSK